MGYGMRNNVPYASNVKSGALLALHKNVNINAIGLETEPNRMMAWTLQNYGMYNDDTTAHWPAENYAIGAEAGQDGDFETAFENAWGYSFNGRGRVRNRDENPFLRDMERIMRIIQVVDNNSETSVGGGGTPRQPLAPPFN